MSSTLSVTYRYYGPHQPLRKRTPTTGHGGTQEASHMNYSDKECVVQEAVSDITAGTAEAVPVLIRTAVCGTAFPVV